VHTTNYNADGQKIHKQNAAHNKLPKTWMDDTMIAIFWSCLLPRITSTAISFRIPDSMISLASSTEIYQVSISRDEKISTVVSLVLVRITECDLRRFRSICSDFLEVRAIYFRFLQKNDKG
jgi:hypothetical protein